MKPITIVGLVLISIMILAWFGVFDGLLGKGKSKTKKNKKKTVKVVKPVQVVKISEIQTHPLDEGDEGDEGDDWGDEGDDWGDDGGDWGDDGGDWGDDGSGTPEIIQLPPVVFPEPTPVVPAPVAPVSTGTEQILTLGDWKPITVPLNTASPSVCSLRSAPITDWGYNSYRGWYDTENCGKKNRYCRWVGGLDKGNPVLGTSYYSAKYGDSKWACSTATDQYGYLPATWSADYLKSDTEQY